MKLAILIAGPWVLAGAWWLFSRAYAHIFEGSRLSDEMRRRQDRSFWIVLGCFYVLVLAVYLATHFRVR